MTAAPFNEAGADAHDDATVAEWLRKAAGDMRIAERELAVTDHPTYDAVCFHAQQGAEKLLKAALHRFGRTPPKAHDLVHLSALLQKQLSTWSFPVHELSELSSAAVEARYPGFSAQKEDAARALDVATRLWVALRPLL